eukprot:GHVU01042444.1.p1 GENE.GHVU01042444.1~~GHVU01042444.1.p1  ORF type:complete len:116 (-),score=1.23 GHVU01042444.1:137-484(-)
MQSWKSSDSLVAKSNSTLQLSSTGIPSDSTALTHRFSIRLYIIEYIFTDPRPAHTMNHTTDIHPNARDAIRNKELHKPAREYKRVWEETQQRAPPLAGAQLAFLAGIYLHLSFCC